MPRPAPGASGSAPGIPPGLIDARDLRLLGHDLSHQHGPRLAGGADTQRAGVGPIPVQEGRLEHVALRGRQKASPTTRRLRRGGAYRTLHLPFTRPRRWSCTIWAACRTAHRRRAAPASSRPGDGTHHRGSWAARLAIARASAAAGAPSAWRARPRSEAPSRPLTVVPSPPRARRSRPRMSRSPAMRTPMGGSPRGRRRRATRLHRHARGLRRPHPGAPPRSLVGATAGPDAITPGGHSWGPRISAP